MAYLAEFKEGVQGGWFEVGTITVDPPSIAAGATANVDITVSGAAVGDVIFVMPPSDLEGDLKVLGASVVAANTVRIGLKNEGSVAVDGVSKEWGYLLFHKA